MGFLGIYKALYDYAPQSEGELTISEGDLLYVLEKSDEDDWWKAKKKASVDEDDEPVGEARDDERSGTRYNVGLIALTLAHSAHSSITTQYAWFHVIFAIGAMYVAMLLTDWNVVRSGAASGGPDKGSDVYIGRSVVAMWMRVVSSWACILLYIWSLVAPVLMPDR